MSVSICQYQKIYLAQQYRLSQFEGNLAGHWTVQLGTAQSLIRIRCQDNMNIKVYLKSCGTMYQLHYSTGFFYEK